MRVRVLLNGGETRFDMDIEVPEFRDDEEYIDEFLDTILAEPFRYDTAWEFL